MVGVALKVPGLTGAAGQPKSSADNTMRSPFLHADDIIRIAPVFHVDSAQGLLLDTALSAAHAINARGIPLCVRLQKWTSLQVILQKAAHYNLTTEEITDTLAFINSVGGLQVQRGYLQRLQAIYTILKHALCGVLYAPITWRRTVSWKTLILGLFRASWPVGCAAFCVLLLLTSAHFISAAYAFSVGLYAAYIFIASLFVHEYTHFNIIHKSTRSAFVLQQGMRIGLVHNTLSPQQERLSSLLGPIAGSIFCLVSAIVALTIQQPIIAVVAIVMGGIHCSSLLPWYGDGATLHKLRRKQRIS